MSRTTKHTLIGKFHNGILTAEQMPKSIINYWNRINFDRGYVRKNKIEYFAKLSKQEIKEVA